MKRVAGSDLNHDNWDNEEEKEERGQFLTADKNTIANRKVIVAKRKPTSGTSGVFRGQNVFSQMSNSSFSFNLPPKTESSTTSDRKIDSNDEKHMKALKVLNQQFLDCITKHIADNPICVLTPTLDDYNKNLSIIKAKYPLSASDTVSTQSNVSSSQSKPADNLFPSLQSSEQQKSNIKFGFTSQTTDNANSVKIDTKPFSFAVNKDKVDTDQTKSFKFVLNKDGKTEESKLFPFGLDKAKEKDCSDETKSSSTDNKSIFGNQSSLFGTSAASSASSMFNFPTTGANTTSGTGFSFIPNPTPNGTSLFGAAPQPVNNEDDENEEYVPPVAEVKDVKESDSVFDIKCKLFYQKDSEWKQRGVGNLFVKPMSGGGKFQLVIRADNSLATIILNVVVKDRKLLTTNKNNVSLFACTDFIEKNKMTPLLIRVKTEDNAKELLKAMEDQL